MSAPLVANQMSPLIPWYPINFSGRWVEKQMENMHGDNKINWRQCLTWSLLLFLPTQAVNTFKKEQGQSKREKCGSSQSQNPTPTPSPVPTPPPPTMQIQPQKPYQPTHSQQVILLMMCFIWEADRQRLAEELHDSRANRIITVLFHSHMFVRSQSNSSLMKTFETLRRHYTLRI